MLISCISFGGRAVSLSADGTILAQGGLYDNNGIGKSVVGITVKNA